MSVCLLAILSLLPSAHAASEGALSVGLSAGADPQLRYTSPVAEGRWVWQASMQAFSEGAASPTLTPRLSSGELWLAPRVGRLWRNDMGERWHLELGVSANPVAMVEGAVLGARSDLPVLGTVFMAHMGLFHGAEYSAALALDLGQRVGVWTGFQVSPQHLWWSGGSVMDDEELTEAQALHLLQPSVGLRYQF